MAEHGLTSRSVASRVALAVFVALVGFLLTAQVRSQRSVTSLLEAESEEDLTRIFASLNEESAGLRDEIAGLRLELARLESSAAGERVAREGARRELSQLEILAGLVPVKGPGVVVRITDPEDEFDFELLLDLVQELRDAGAEALSVNGRRVGAATAFSSLRGRLTVGGVPVDAPYEVEAIGDPDTLEGGLNIPGGAIDTLSAVETLAARVERRRELRVAALDPVPAFRVAEPAG